jgi:hypothetical protein
VNVDDVLTPGIVMEAIDVLRQQREAIDGAFDSNQGVVCRIGCGVENVLRQGRDGSPRAIGVTRQRGPTQGLDGAFTLVRVVVEATYAAVRWEAGFCGEARPRDDAHRAHRSETLR